MESRRVKRYRRPMTAALTQSGPRHGFAFRWPLTAAAAALLMLGVAHAFEAMGYAPCDLCLRQRELYWAIAGVAIAGALALNREGWRRYQPALIAVLGILFLIQAWLAAYHAGVEWKWWPGPTHCSGRGASVSSGAMGELLAGKSLHIVRCDQAAWRLLGLSMAGWNALAALALSVLSAVAAARAARAIRG